MADVAVLAGVSTQTVSRYLSGTGYVGADTRRRIGTVIDELGYRPNSAARQLRVKRSGTIGVLAVGPLNYGTATLLAGLTDAARRVEYPLVIAHVDLSADLASGTAEVRGTLDFFLSSHVDGLVMTTPYLGSERLLSGAWEQRPVVTVSGRPLTTADSASVDSYAAGVGATEHLADFGHRRILHVAGPADRVEALDRARGYHDVLKARRLRALPVARGDWSAESGHAVGLAADPARFSAVFAGNDQMALGFMAAMRERSLRAGTDYSIIGVDDMPDARYLDPPLSSMFLDFTGLGGTAFSMIHRRIRTGERLDRVCLPPEIRVRASTAPPRRQRRR